MRPRRTRSCAVALVIICLALAGCGSGKAGQEGSDPAEVTPIKGTDVNRVVLTQDAFRNVDIHISRVAKEATAVVSVSGKSTPSVIPITALIYDPNGKAWTYTMPAARTFVRAAVVVRWIDGATVHLSSGPPVGTQVVTVGAPLLMGAEYGVGEE